jgi:hypothetical protein
MVSSSAIKVCPLQPSFPRVQVVRYQQPAREASGLSGIDVGEGMLIHRAAFNVDISRVEHSLQKGFFLLFFLAFLNLKTGHLATKDTPQQTKAMESVPFDLRLVSSSPDIPRFSALV